MAGGAGQVPEEAGDREEREARHQHPGDRTGAEGEGQALLQPGLGRGGGADVRAHRDVHPDEAGRARQHGTQHEAGGRNCAEGGENDDGHHDANDGDGGILTLQIGLCAFLNSRGNFLHLGVTRRCSKHLIAGEGAVYHGRQTQQDRYGHKTHDVSPYIPRRPVARPLCLLSRLGVATKQTGRQAPNPRVSAVLPA